MTQEEQRLREENEELKNEIRELRETLDAISVGEVDAIVVSQDDERKVYTLENADQPYRVLIENIREGALTLSRDGMILYGNTAFASMRGLPLSEIIGTNLRDHIAPRDKDQLNLMIQKSLKEPMRCDMTICGRNSSFPVQISMTSLDLDGKAKISAVVTDHRRDYELLRLQGRMLNGVADAVIAADPTGKIIYWNEAATKTYGWKPEEVIGRDLVSVAVPAILEKDSQTILKRLMSGETWSGEYTVQHRDGHLFPIHAMDAPVFDDDGHLIAVIGATHDITERKKVEEATFLAKKQAEEALELLQALYENAGIGFAFLDTEFRYRFINRLLAELNGIPEKDHIGRKMRDLFPGWWELMQPVFTRVLHTGVPVFDLELKGEAPLTPGIIRFWLENVFRVQLPDGQVLGIGVALHEITDRKKMEMLIRESEERYRELVENANSIIIKMDNNGKISFFNEYAQQFFGYSRDEILGKNVRLLLPLKESSSERNLEEMVDTILKNPDEFVENVNENIRKNGDRVWISWHNKAIWDAEGNLTGNLAIGQDISEQRRSEEALRRRNEDLNAANKEIKATQDELHRIIEELGTREHDLNEALAEKEILLSEIHHRVKNNLTAFISLLSLESSYTDSPTGLALKKDLQNRARSMALIHDTLYRTKNYSRVNMDVYLSTLVGQIVRSYESAKSIKTVVDAHGITLDLSRATPGGLIVNELLTNSLKYAFPASFDCGTIRGASCTIEVNLTQDDGGYVLTVRDNGIGLPPDLDIGSIKTLGLKLVSFLAKHQLRSSIEIRSDKGAEFRFRFRDKK